MINFWSHFCRLLVRRPGPALTAAYWHLTRRRVRARNTLRDGTRGLDLAYWIWLRQQSARGVKGPGSQKVPSLSILIHGQASDGSSASGWQRSERSVKRQESSAPPQVLQGSDLAALLTQVEGDYVFFLRDGAELAGGALAMIERALALHDPAILYGDEDRPRSGSKIREPWFKPNWNAEMFLALDYLSGAVAIRTSLAREIASETDRTACLTLDTLLLEATRRAATSIVHLPAILTHASNDADSAENRLEAVRAHLKDRANCLPGPHGTVRVQWPMPEPCPLVSIVIPTRDKVDLLRPCVEGLLERTSYRPFEILVVDNGSQESGALAYLEQLSRRDDVRVLRSDAAYNFSALNNLAVREAAGSFVLLLNNDTEVIDPDWLSEMMRHAARDDVGAVGAKLLYSDGSLQHAGVVVGMGDAAGHAHRYLPPGHPGYFRQPHVAQFVTAVTAACLLVERAKYDAVGGLDEESFAIAYNDVDFCLKLERAGWRNIYTPHATLYHHESKSRGHDLSPQHRARYMKELATLQERWGTKTFADPLHSIHLDRYSETYLPKFI